MQVMILISKVLVVLQLLCAGTLLVTASLIGSGLKRYRRYVAGSLAERELTEEEREMYARMTARDLRLNAELKVTLETAAAALTTTVLVLASVSYLFIY